MRYLRSITLTICLLAFVTCLALRGSAQATYTVTDLGTLPGGTASAAYSINSAGQVTGVANTLGGEKHAFLWSAGIMVDLGTLGGNSSTGYGINDAGQVTGGADTSSVGLQHAFVYSAGTMTDLGVLAVNGGSSTSVGYAINASGQVTGAATNSTGALDAFFFSADKMFDLGALPGGEKLSIRSTGKGINASGQVTGLAYVAYGKADTFLAGEGSMDDLGPGFGNGINAFEQIVGGDRAGHAVLYIGGVPFDLGTLPGGDFSYGQGINDYGQVVGHGNTKPNGPYSAFLYTKGKGMVDLNTLIPSGSGWILTNAAAINNSAQIAGQGFINGAPHAFLLTPTGLITPQSNSCDCPPGNSSQPQVGAAQGAQVHPVNTAFGTFFESFSDFAIPGRGLPLSFAHSYSSVFAGVDGPLGYGWTHNYAIHLIQQGTSVIVTQETGSQVTFNPVSGGGYTAPPSVIATLEKNADGTLLFTRREQQFFTFSSKGQLISESDRNGYTTKLVYNDTGQLTTVTDPAGRSLKFTYTGSQLASVTDPIGRKVGFAYDSKGNLSVVKDVAGGLTKFTYTPTHLLLSVTDPRGGVVTSVYDSSNRVISQSDQLGRKTSFSYSLGSTTTTDPEGNVTREKYNQFNQRTSLTLGFGTSLAATWTFTYDPDTLGITSVTDPNGHTSTVTYDDSANLLKSTDAMGRVTTRTWDAMNDLTSVDDALRVTTTLKYDAMGNLLTRSRPLIGTNSVQTYTFQYGDAAHPGDVTGVVDPNGKTTTYTYDSDGNRITIKDPLGHLTKFTYNGIGWLTVFTDARGKQTAHAYNLFGDPTVTTDPLGHKVVRAYDANRNLSSIEDANGNITGYSCDLADQRTKTTRADGTTLETSYGSDGTVSKTIDGMGRITKYSYNPLALPISVTDPLGRSTKYTYDGVGDQLTLTDPSGQVTTYTYDADQEITSISYSDGKTPHVTLAYDADGQRTSMTDGTGTSSWGYDSLRRVTATRTGAGTELKYSYDLKGQLTKITYPGVAHSVSRTWDDSGRLISIADWLGNSTTYSYDPDGNLTIESLPATTGFAAKYSYDAASWLSSIVDSQKGATLASFTYTRDADNLITRATEIGDSLPGTDTYGYTKLNQLASVNVATYSYDAGDNVTGLITPSEVKLKYDAANELTTLTAGGAVTTFAYDNRGNRLSRTAPSKPALSYAYDQASRLTAFGAIATYHYNGDGLRMAKTVSGTAEAFTWQDAGALPLLIADGTAFYIYGPEGLPLEQVTRTGTALFYLHDQLGSTRLLINGSGAVKAAYTYDSYGDLLATTGAAANPFGYAGQFTDPESGQIYLRARYYDSATAQFISRDPLADTDRSSSPYGYGDDNPLNETDPSGFSPNPTTYQRLYEYLVRAIGGKAADAAIAEIAKQGRLNFVEQILEGAPLSPVKCGNWLTTWFRWLHFEAFTSINPGVNPYNPWSDRDQYEDFLLYSIIRGVTPATIPISEYMGYYGHH
jgi:RHS repeat-associated protein